MNGKTKSLIALIAALVGIVLAIVGCWFMAQPGVVVIGVILGVVGIVFGALCMKSMKDEGQSTGMAVAGLVVGIVGVVLGLIFLPCACAARETINALETYGSSLTDYANSLSSLLS
ncbi:MAG: hypothetical protein IJ725_04725 [Ruminococcus sp.]|nr:hypothetical protein [Ruminococcus sp.]